MKIMFNIASSSSSSSSFSIAIFIIFAMTTVVMTFFVHGEQQQRNNFRGMDIVNEADSSSKNNNKIFDQHDAVLAKKKKNDERRILQKQGGGGGRKRKRRKKRMMTKKMTMKKKKTTLCDNCNNLCQNRYGTGVKVKVKGFQNPKTCVGLANKDACNNELNDGSGKRKFVYEVCRSSCDKCIIDEERSAANNPTTASPTVSPTASQTGTGSSNGGGNNRSIIINPVLVPQCDPNDPNSFLSTKNPMDTFPKEYCDQHIEYCDKKMSTLQSPWKDTGDGSGKFVWIQPDEFYDTVESLYERCSKTCSDQVGGIEQFCTMPDVPKQKVDESYCGSIITNDITSVAMMIQQQENDVLKILNEKRFTPDGIVCNTNTDEKKYKYYPQSSPLVMNDALRCAARIKAKNIVDTIIERNGQVPNNLNTACPINEVCDDYWDRSIKSGYNLLSNNGGDDNNNYVGYGWVNENTAANFQTSTSVVNAWLNGSSSCGTVMKQESIVVTGEVGIGYYVKNGYTGYVMIKAQRTL